MQNLNVNITPDNYPQSLYYSQNDVGREFKINITDFTIPVGATVKIQATKPSGFGFSVAGAVSGNSVTFETTDEMTDEAGRFPAELVIESGAVVIGTANFLMVGEMNPHPEGTTDGSQGTIIPELTLLVERVEAAASSVLDMQVVAQTLPAGSQASYSYDEDLNKATFGIPEGQAGAGAAGVVASAYSAAKTYKVGDYVLYNSNLYRCTTAITTAEAWTAAHWTQIVLADDVTDLKTDFNASVLTNADMPIPEGAWIRYSNGEKVVSTATNLYVFTGDLPKSIHAFLTSDSASLCAIAFYSSDGITTDGYISASSVGFPSGTHNDGLWYNAIVPSNCKTIAITTKKPSASVADSIILFSNEYYLNKVEKEVFRIDRKLFNVAEECNLSGYIDNGGFFNSLSTYKCSDYIPIKNGDSFSYRLSHGTVLPIIAFYGTDKTYDSTKTIKGVSGYSEGTYTATADGYIRFVYATARPDVSVIFTTYIPDNIKALIPNNGIKDMTILCLGDSIFGEDDDITSALGILSGANVINGAVGGTRATDRGGGHGFSDFDGVNLIEALCTNTWTDQDAGADAIKDTYTWITAKLALLKSIDMSEVDMITFNWATNDYTASVAMADIVSAHNTIIDTILTYYPTVRIVVVSPIWRYFDQPSDNKNADNFAYNVNTLKEISNAIVENAHDQRITVFDAYKNMPLNYKTASSYYNSGSDVHLNATGGKLFAHYINGFINSIC